MKVPAAIRELMRKNGASAIGDAIADMLDAKYDISPKGEYDRLLREALSLLKAAAKINHERRMGRQ